MKKRKFGDVYLVEVEGQLLGAIQHVGDDPTLPGSNVIRALVNLPLGWESIDTNAFALLPRAFPAHVFLGAGETLAVWRKIGNRGYPDSSDLFWCSVSAQDFGKSESKNWEIWRTGEIKRDPLSTKELEACEFGHVMAPDQIVCRLKTGKYTLPIPARCI